MIGAYGSLFGMAAGLDFKLGGQTGGDRLFQPEDLGGQGEVRGDEKLHRKRRGISPVGAVKSPPRKICLICPI
jgi:hypothetical protein